VFDQQEVTSQKSLCLTANLYWYDMFFFTSKNFIFRRKHPEFFQYRK